MPNSFAAPPNRVYVNDPRNWGIAPGTDFLLDAGTTTALITSGTAGASRLRPRPVSGSWMARPKAPLHWRQTSSP